MGSRTTLFGFLLGCAGCASPTTLLVTVEAAAGVSVQAPLTIAVTAGAFTRSTHASEPPRLPGTLLVRLPDIATAVTVTVAAPGLMLASATTTSVPHAEVQLTILLGSSPPRCDDAIKNSDETGIDCGGSCPLACPGAPCSANAACVTQSCDGRLCALASGPPGWIPAAALGTRRAFLQLGLGKDGRLYAVGGSTTTRAASAVGTVEALSPGATSWTPVPDLLTPRSAHAVAVGLDGTLYAFGGLSASGAVLGTLEAFGGVRWNSRTSAPSGHSQIAAVTLPDGSLFVGDSTPYPVYSPANNSWSTLPSPMQVRDSLGLALGADGRVYAVGGHVSAGAVATLDAYRVGVGWTSMAPMSVSRSFPGAAAAPDGRVYAVGGISLSAGPSLASVEAYDPVSNHWTAVAALGAGRIAPGVAVGADGRVYAVGGSDGVAGLASVEAYGPVARLSATSGRAGDAVSASATNFAAGASLSLSFDGTPLATGSTDATGAAQISFVVPALALGSHDITLVDNRSQYPVHVPFELQ